MVARSVGLYADAIRDFWEATTLPKEQIAPGMREFAEKVADAVQAQAKEAEAAIREVREEMEKLKGKSGGRGGGDESKKDRKRTEPKDPFNGTNHIDWEWRLNNHMETCFGAEGRRLMKWIRERAKRMRESQKLRAR